MEYQKLRDMRPGETSANVRAWVEAARERQRIRFEGTNIASNADMRPATITFTDLFTIERRASPKEKVPFSLNGHFQVINDTLQKTGSGFDSSIGTSCCFFSRGYSSLIPSRSF